MIERTPTNITGKATELSTLETINSQAQVGMALLALAKADD